MLGQPAEDNTYSNRGLIMRKSNEDLEREEARRQSDITQNSPVILSLAAHVQTCWTANKAHKQRNIEETLLQCLRQVNGKYDPDVLSKIKTQGDSEIFMMITDIKCRAAIAWLVDILTPAGQTPFHFQPTPSPELPPEYYDQAKQAVSKQMQEILAQQGMDPRRVPVEQLRQMMAEIAPEIKKELLEKAKEDADVEAEKLTNEVNDQLTEGGWYDAIGDFCVDLVHYPAAFLHGPIVRKKRKLTWEQGPNGESIPTINPVVVREYEAVSPFDMYPSANAKTVQDGNLIHRIKFSRQDLVEMIGVPGFDEDAIRAVLAVHGAGGLVNWTTTDSERAILEDHDNFQRDPEAVIECLKFMGNVQGQMLLDWGMSSQEISDPDIDYPAVVYLIGSYVISARLNSHPLGRRRYYSTSFVKKRNTIWGRGVPQIMRDIQRICNSCVRALVKNMGIASGPQVWSIVDRLPDGMVATDMYPWKHWKFTSSNMTGRNDVPMGFFQPRIIVDELLKIFQYFYDQASEITGIPAYVYGSDNVGGAGRTARGLTMLMNAAARGLKMVARSIDRDVITDSVEEHGLHIMLSDPSKYRGDIRVIARASDYLLQKEALQIQQEEFLDKTNNPVDMEIIGYEGRGEILREIAKSLNIPVNKLVPDREELLQVTADKKLMGMIQNIADQLGVPAQQLLQIAHSQPAGGPQK